MKRFLRIPKIPLTPLFPLMLLFAIALLAPILSNNKPIAAWDQESGLRFPALDDRSPETYTSGTKWTFAIHPPIPWSPSDIDFQNAGQPPLSTNTSQPWYFTHWLGTDEIGRDVLAHLIYGCRSSVLIALGAMAIALVIGLLLGAIGGYWHGMNIRWPLLFLLFTGLSFLLLINAVHILNVQFRGSWSVLLSVIVGLMLMGILKLAHHLITRKLNFRFLRFSAFRFSPDSAVLGLINFFTAIPAYFALLAMLALWPEPSAFSLSAILGLLMWPDLARLTRSSVIRLKNTGLAESAESLGYSPGRIMFVHLLPNALQPALAALSFGIGGAIMAESFLSFVGIAPAELVSWGTLLAKTRSYPDMWWLSVFPGLAILIAILSFYRLANQLEKMNIKL